MEAIIISLLLFFSNADFVLSNGNLDQSAQHTQSTTIEEGNQTHEDETMVESSSKGKLGHVDLDGF
jgi:hypothetical protein